MSAIVHQIDHIIIEAADEQAVFDWFTQTLGLPVAWPVGQWGPIHEGGACVGEVNLGCNHLMDPASDPWPAIRAIALQPVGGYEVVLPELDVRGIDYSAPMVEPGWSPADPLLAPWNEGWTNRLVMGWREGTPVAFFCLYHHDSDARRAREVERLRSEMGGRLGITRLQELIVESSDVAADLAGWRNLLQPATEQEPGLFRIGRGPDLRVVPGDTDRYLALVFKVESQVRAAAALDELGIAYEKDELIRLDPADALGLDVRLAG